jgi:hypothetical protein
LQCREPYKFYFVHAIYVTTLFVHSFVAAATTKALPALREKNLQLEDV